MIDYLKKNRRFMLLLSFIIAVVFISIATSSTYAVTNDLHGTASLIVNQKNLNAVSKYSQSLPNITGKSTDNLKSPTDAVLSGKIVDYYGNTLSGVLLTLEKSNGQTITTTTDSMGNYSFTVSPGFYGSIRAYKLHYCFSPSSIVYSNIQSSLDSQNFSGYYVSSTQEIQLSQRQLNFGTTSGNHNTSPQTVLIQNAGKNILDWAVEDNVWWLTCSPTSGSNSGTITISVNPSQMQPGNYYGKITVSSPTAFNSPQYIYVNLTVFSQGETKAPFGELSTPSGNTPLHASIPVTGWALDDIEVSKVQIYCDNAYIGDALFVEGARPDVENSFSAYPFKNRAGWGYMMLSNFLPNGGNGTYTLSAKAIDSEGNESVIGSQIFTCDNANAVKPFGAIDTPQQGSTVSGKNYVNWGWALTPQPNTIPTDGSTINVWIDGVNIGNPTYNIYRSDLESYFPGYSNSNGAAGYSIINTTKYENGLHTIHWTASDDAGNSDGIGSRFFNIVNSTNLRENSNPILATSQTTLYPIPLFQYKDRDMNNATQLKVRYGYNLNSPLSDISSDDSGVFTIEMQELGRIEIHFPLSDSDKQIQNENSIIKSLFPLPIGSTLDTKNGIFYWSPGAGFIGEYSLNFSLPSQEPPIQIKVKIHPYKKSNS